MAATPGAEDRVNIYDDGGPGVAGPWRLCAACAALRGAGGRRTRKIGQSFETGSRCEDCGAPNAPIAEAWRGPDYLYYLAWGHYEGVAPDVVLEAMRKNAPVPAEKAHDVEAPNGRRHGGIVHDAARHEGREEGKSH